MSNSVFKVNPQGCCQELQVSPLHYPIIRAMGSFVSALEFQEFDAGVKFSIQIKPNSRKTELIVESDGTLRMNVAAPPTGGKANREIVRWLAKRFRRPSSEVRLVGGFHSRTKIIAVLNIGLEELTKNLSPGDQ